MIFKYSYLKNNLDDCLKKKYFLFYGNNLGKIESGQSALISNFTQNYNCTSVFISASEIRKNSLLEIISKYDSSDIFGSEFILTILLDEKSLNKELINIIKNQNLNKLRLILKTDKLEKNSGLRKFFESSDDSIIVPCYEETYVEKLSLIKEELEREKLSIESSIAEYLANRLSNQRSEILNELEKIKIILRLNKSTGDFTKILSNSIFFDETAFIFDIVSGNTQNFNDNYQKFTDYEKNEIRLINALIEHFFKILLVKDKVSRGISARQALKELKPPVFFKFEKTFESHLKIWETKNIEFYIKKLLQAQKLFFKGSLTASSNLKFLILSITQKNITVDI